MPTRWRDSRLWKELERRDDGVSASVKAALPPLLDDLETVLSAAATGDANFTLHDEEHSMRVAERIAELLGEQLEQVSAYDVGFCLAAAYAHDVGMTPELGRVQAHYDALLAIGMPVLTDTDAAAFQRWLDDEHDGLIPPLADGRPTAAQLHEARLIVGHYARARHNDWSEEWLRDWAATPRRSLYPGWVDHLVRICRSHHEGYERLSAADFEPQLVGSPAELLHLRHCAVLLRVADVLENDPERTPDVVFERRAVDESSWTYWRKDHYISVKQEGTRFTLSARPPDSATHHAIVETVAAIDAELGLSRRLADEHHFSVAPNVDYGLPNHWHFESRLRVQITPLDDRYEYVDATFRPDVRRVLQLLGGVELYGSPWAAVREMLQNAFDAVKEQIALERLGWRDPSDEEGVAHLRRQHVVRLELCKSEDGTLKIECSDTGVGMTKEQIVQRFLVSGSGKRHHDRDLERRCAAAGFALDKTARYGIGVLAYFLLGAPLALETRRSPLALDHDRTTWHFVTGGPGTFGELTRSERATRGTTVEVTLRSLDFEDPARLAESLREYLMSTVQFTPCSFEFADQAGGAAFACEPGWAPWSQPPRWTTSENPFEVQEDRRFGLASRADRAAAQRHSEGLAEARERYEAQRRWIVEERPLPSGAGSYELRVPWFETDYGPSLVGFTALHPDRASAPVAERPVLDLSWNGMRASARGPEVASLEYIPPTIGWIARIDFVAELAGAPSVSRNEITVTKKGREMIAEVLTRATDVMRTFADQHRDADVALLNHQLARLPLPDAPRCWWSKYDGEAPAWQPITFPAVGGISNFIESDSRVQWRGERLMQIMEAPIADHSASWFPLPPELVTPWNDADGQPMEILPIWTDVGRSGTGTRPDAPPHCAFPAEWKDVLAVGTGLLGMPVVLNKDHPGSAVISADALAWRKRTAVFDGLVAAPEELCENPARVLALFLWFAQMRDDRFWQILGEERPDAMRQAYTTLAQAVDGAPIAAATWEPAEEGSGWSVRALTATGLVQHDLPLVRSGTITVE